ncbi:MAG: putative transporter [Bacteroides sp.]|nr:putative transporter [Bacteroides sp.]MBD5320275.1 putative transporter [Bacteroides sp.]MBD5350722.1 putative transporter [Bacteroides sp.]MBD5421604.1 putative transporter [Bacteroides sp.]MDE6051489.1 putative transporter [Paramuribaculum sp.]
MDFSWLVNLLGPGQTSLASTLVLYSFVIALGVFLGKIKVGSVSLGVTFVLFVGIIMGHLGYIVNPEVLKFIREFGLILFIFAIGIQVGPGFFSSFKKGGVRLNMLAVAAIALNVIIVLVIYFIEDGHTTMPALVGVMSGAVTNTPGLAAAQQAVGDNVEAINTMSMGYAAAYPLGVCGIIGAMFLIKAIFRIRIDNEIKAIEEENEKLHTKPNFVSIEVTNHLINGKSLRELHDIVQCDFVISRLMDQSGNIIIPTSQTQVRVGDKLYVVISTTDTPRFESVVGPEVEVDWEEVTPSRVVSRRILITKSQYNGVALGSLRLHAGYQLNATRVNRAGVDLLASPDLRLQMGDRITVVGDLNDIDRLANRLGNSMKRLNEPNMITIFVGILFGIIVGSINLGWGMKLGLAGGPLVVAILLSRFGYKFKLVTYTSSSASLLMRELGICLFLASVGISSGKDFAATVFNQTGMWWVIWGFIITFLPIAITGCIARGVYKINYLTIMGLFSGGYTDPPALAYANSATGNDAPAVAYSTVYPLTMFLRVVAAQGLILAFMS